MRILFILKNQLISGGYSAPGRSSGLYHSARFVCDMLETELGHICKLVVVQDNNNIDREVAQFHPDVCVIEALWVVPEKFQVLHQLHPNVIWIIRNHSAVPFLAQEGMSMAWLLRYPDFPNVFVSCNDTRTKDELQLLSMLRTAGGKEVLYLPNYYPTQFHARRRQPGSRALDVGCFGAIRPLKNQLIQAVAAIQFATYNEVSLRFHINGTRSEGGGDPVLKNLRNLFELTPKHALIEHPWMSRHDFIRVLRGLDVGMQCSYTETFNIVTADAVMNDVPVVVSPEVEWVHQRFQVAPNSSNDIVQGLHNALEPLHGHHRHNRDRLVHFSRQAVFRWGEALNELAQDC